MTRNEDPALFEEPLDGLLELAFRTPRPGVRLSAAQAERFEVLGVLGTGGMGSVLRARDRTLDRLVALKFVRPELLRHAEARERFLREGRFLSQFNHPGLCQLYDYVPGPTSDLLVMELVEGVNLDAAAQGPASRTTRLEWMLALTRALSVAHGAGIIHRDLKPANVMVTAAGVVKVLDFGIARADADAGEPAPEGGDDATIVGPYTQAGRLIGTPKYMAPEQRRGEVATAASDLYALGLLLGEVLAPRPGWRDRELRQLVAALTSERPTDRPSVLQVERVLMRTLARPRRRTVQVVVLSTVLAFGWLGFRYVRDLGRERDLVLARQGQSERLIDFVVGDVAERLEKTGPPELVAQLDEQALAYFKAVDGRYLSDEELRHWVAATIGVAERIRVHNRLAAAREVLHETQRFLDERLAQAPGATEWLFQRGQISFYIGQIERDAGDLAAAAVAWEHYAAVMRELAELEPERRLYQDEVAYSLTNLGVLDLERAQSFRDDSLGAAEACFAQALDYWVGRQATDAEAVELAVEVADARSWMIEVLKTKGDFTQAVRFARQVHAANQSALAADRFNRELEHRVVLSGYFLGKTLLIVGDLDEGGQLLSEAANRGASIVGGDHGRTEWFRTWALCLGGVATFQVLAGEYELAVATSERALTEVRRLLAVDPANADWQSLRGPLVAYHAETLYLAGRVADARAELRTAPAGQAANLRADDAVIMAMVAWVCDAWADPERVHAGLVESLADIRSADTRWQGERIGYAALVALGADDLARSWLAEECRFFQAKGQAAGEDHDG